MSRDQRKKNANWIVTDDDGRVRSTEHAQLAVLMDIRDELQEANRRLAVIEMRTSCHNVSRGFVAMNKIRLHLEKHGARPKPAAKKKRGRAK